jgi:hypothetical protein
MPLVFFRRIGAARAFIGSRGRGCCPERRSDVLFAEGRPCRADQACKAWRPLGQEGSATPRSLRWKWPIRRCLSVEVAGDSWEAHHDKRIQGRGTLHQLGVGRRRERATESGTIFVMRRVSLLATISALVLVAPVAGQAAKPDDKPGASASSVTITAVPNPIPYGHSVTISGKLTAKTLSHDADHAIGVSELRRITVH